MGSDARHQPIAGEQSDAMQSYPLASGKTQDQRNHQKLARGLKFSGHTLSDSQRETAQLTTSPKVAVLDRLLNRLRAGARLLVVVVRTHAEREAERAVAREAAAQLLGGQRRARACDAVAGRPEGRPLPGSAALPGAARRALRRRRSRAGALLRLYIPLALRRAGR